MNLYRAYRWDLVQPNNDHLACLQARSELKSLCPPGEVLERMNASTQNRHHLDYLELAGQCFELPDSVQVGERVRSGHSEDSWVGVVEDEEMVELEATGSPSCPP